MGMTTAVSVVSLSPAGVRRLQRAPGAGVLGGTMSVCRRTNVCPLFTVPAMRLALPLWRGRYCDERPELCQRLQLLESGAIPPMNMLPNGKLMEVQTGPR
jgi:hypothetical protein